MSNRPPSDDRGRPTRLRPYLATLALLTATPLAAQSAGRSASARDASARPGAELPPPAGARLHDARLRTGVRVRYLEQGDPAGTPVILLHGYSDSWRSFRRVLPLLPSRLRVLVPDQRGHGDSERPATGYAMRDLALDVVALMDATGIRRATIVGHSMGSLVAQQVALAAPDRVDRLVLVGAATAARQVVGIDDLRAAVEGFGPPDAPAPEAFVREFQESTVHRPVPPEFMDEMVAASGKLPSRVWRALLDGMLRADPPAALAGRRIPTLLLWGERDAYFPRSEQTALQRLLGTATLVTYADVGHAPHWEIPERVAADLTTFLDAPAATAAAAPNASASVATPVAGARFDEARLATGVRLRYAVAGDPAAPPVVLLHGLTDSWYSFSPVLAALATRHRVYALDLRGHGGSERPTAGYTMPEMAGDVVAFLDALGIERAAVVGHSMGSFVARRVALAAPTRVTRLVLVGSGIRAATKATLELPAAFATLPDSVPDAFAREWQVSSVHATVPADFMERVILECRQPPARVWRAALAGMLADPPATADRAPRMPTLLVSGDRDAMFLLADQDALARTWPSARLLRYADIGHAPHWEAPDRFVQDVMAFLAP